MAAPLPSAGKAHLPLSRFSNASFLHSVPACVGAQPASRGPARCWSLERAQKGGGATRAAQKSMCRGRGVSRASTGPTSALPLPLSLPRRVRAQRVLCRAAADENLVEGTSRGPALPGPTSTGSCCCSQEGVSAAEEAPSVTPPTYTLSLPSQGPGYVPAVLLGSLLLAPVALLLLYPSLLPFDLDDVQDWLDEAVYFASHELNRTLNSQLGAGAGASNALAPSVLSLVFGAGVITSFAPCTLSVLPLTIGFVGGLNNDKEKESEGQTSVVSNAIFFALGLATTFSSLGISAALAGKAYGQMGPGLPIAVSALTMYMGFNLLGLVQFQVPSFFANFDPKEAAGSLPEPVQMFLGGMTFALLASPCSTPVLASLLGYVASSEDVVVGFALLLAYTFGRVMPVLVAASFTGSLKQLLSLRQYSRWINPASGTLLLGLGTFSLLNRVFPEATAMALGMGGGGHL